MAEIVGADGEIVTVDIDPAVAETARRHLSDADYPRVRVVVADGVDGYPDRAPYDRIVATVGVWDLPPAWLDQLSEHGRLLIPLSLRGVQRSIAFERGGHRLTSRSIVDCGFMPMRGRLAAPQAPRPVPGRSGAFLQYDGDHAVDMEALVAAIDQPGPAQPTGLTVSASEVMGGLGLWIVLSDPGAGMLADLDDAERHSALRTMRCYPGMRMATALVLLNTDSFAALVPADEDADTLSGPFELAVRGFGPAGSRFADRLMALVQGWNARGRPSSAQLTVTAYPQSPLRPRSGGTLLDRPNTRFLIDWQ